MKSHELAKLLLDNPGCEVMLENDHGGFSKVEEAAFAEMGKFAQPVFYGGQYDKDPAYGGKRLQPFFLSVYFK